MFLINPEDPVECLCHSERGSTQSLHLLLNVPTQQYTVRYHCFRSLAFETVTAASFCTNEKVSNSELSRSVHSIKLTCKRDVKH